MISRNVLVTKSYRIGESDWAEGSILSRTPSVQSEWGDTVINEAMVLPTKSIISVERVDLKPIAGRDESESMLRDIQCFVRFSFKSPCSLPVLPFLIGPKIEQAWGCEDIKVELIANTVSKVADFDMSLAAAKMLDSKRSQQSLLISRLNSFSLEKILSDEAGQLFLPPKTCLVVESSQMAVLQLMTDLGNSL